ncbi:DUF4252 domain-containing protein [Nonlabens sp. SCSIO 43208]|uniref:DUF4252 domain-containing protein n=1 Tax=Nonlabens sp. SCSIO 43208 TaxID=2793009 RepID=UPI003D6AD17F
MKKLLYLAVFILSVTYTTAQNLDAMGNLKNTSETVVTSEMFGLITNIDFNSQDEEVKEMKKMIDKLTELRVYATDNPESATRMAAMANKYIESKKLVKLMHVKEDGQLFTFHMRKGSSDKKIRELVMLINNVNGDEPNAVFLVITGDLDLDQVSKITEKLNVPGQKQIEQATQE